ncbi:MAG: ribosomal protein S18-alanine N-acetyltransferase [Clostridiales bacterium]|nr:ribosomal protein S18-alanine N-acetyltransferase [Clostridiales bacterium]
MEGTGRLCIRKMKESDLEAVAKLERCCFTEPWSYRLLESGIYSPYDVYYVFEQENQILGYCDLRLLAGEGEVQRIAVRPDVRRRGVGRRLMDAMMDFAEQNGATAISLEVREGNEAARRLYETCGFAAEAMRRGYYHNPPEDAVIMWRR